jgi:hypothetical protein
MKTKPFLLHALSPLHAGTGHTADVIDLPTARKRARHQVSTSRNSLQWGRAA